MQGSVPSVPSVLSVPVPSVPVVPSVPSVPSVPFVPIIFLYKSSFLFKPKVSGTLGTATHKEVHFLLLKGSHNPY